MHDEYLSLHISNNLYLLDEIKKYQGADIITIHIESIEEKDILDWKEYNGLEFLNCACSFTEKTNNNEEVSKRKEIKVLSHFFDSLNGRL